MSQPHTEKAEGFRRRTPAVRDGYQPALRIERDLQRLKSVKRIQAFFRPRILGYRVS
jgi:hypothetical protein